eukprot:8589264-Alexandrium_andersonii.AAC.1
MVAGVDQPPDIPGGQFPNVPLRRAGPGRHDIAEPEVTTQVAPLKPGGDRLGPAELPQHSG